MVHAILPTFNEQWKVQTILSNDNVPIRYAVYHKGATEPSRYIVFLNGRTEWMEKYLYLPHDLKLPDDCGFISMDHRGQGGSGGVKAFIDSYRTFAEDTAAVIKVATKGKPYGLMAHSMGGLIGLYTTMSGLIQPKALVLSAPLFMLPNHPVPRFFARPIAMLLSQLGLGQISTGAGGFERQSFENNNLTHSSERYEVIRNTPYPIPGATFGWVYQTFKAIDQIFNPQLLANLNVPTLVMSGGEESIIDPKGHSQWCNEATRFSKAKISLEQIPGAYHELFSEIPQFYNDVIEHTRFWFKDFLR